MVRTYEILRAFEEITPTHTHRFKQMRIRTDDHKWTLDARNNTVGATALHLALFMGPHRLELVKFLIKMGSNLKTTSHTGGTMLMSLIESEDCEPCVTRLLLSQLSNEAVNNRRRSRTAKWFLIRAFSKLATRLNLTFSKASMIRALAEVRLSQVL